MNGSASSSQEVPLPDPAAGESRPGLPAALIFCDSRAMLEDRIARAARGQQYNIHTDRMSSACAHSRDEAGGVFAEAPFAVYQTDQEAKHAPPPLFATGLYQDQLEPVGDSLKIRDS